MLSYFIDYLQCPVCAGSLAVNANYECVSCGRVYEKKEQTVFFVYGENIEAQKDFIFRIKSFFKKYPKIFFIFYNTLGVFTGKTANEAIKNVSAGSLIINLASGVKNIRDDVLNIDLTPFPNVHIVADIHNLPFKDGCADAVICESSLEHFKEPKRVIKEICRVLKPKGLVYISAPFIVGFHASPNDYYRWTLNGLKELLKDFEEKESGVGWGPTYALTSILREWLAVILSFNINLIYSFLSLFFMIVFAPLNFFDYIFSHYKSAKNIAFGFYYIGIKK